MNYLKTDHYDRRNEMNNNNKYTITTVKLTKHVGERAPAAVSAASKLTSGTTNKPWTLDTDAHTDRVVRERSDSGTALLNELCASGMYPSTDLILTIRY